MNAADVVGYTYDGDIYCPRCVKYDKNDPGFYVVFANDESSWSSHCGKCHEALFDEHCTCHYCTREKAGLDGAKRWATERLAQWLNENRRGSGFDSGWRYAWRGGHRITGAFHAMNEGGMYDRWVSFRVNLKLDDDGTTDIRVTFPSDADRRYAERKVLKDYFADTVMDGVRELFGSDWAE